MRFQFSHFLAQRSGSTTLQVNSMKQDLENKIITKNAELGIRQHYLFLCSHLVCLTVERSLSKPDRAFGYFGMT